MTNRAGENGERREGAVRGRYSQAALWHSVTNVFPRELSKVLSEDDYTIAESNAYNQAGINTNP